MFTCSVLFPRCAALQLRRGAVGADHWARSLGELQPHAGEKAASNMLTGSCLL
jgi:hypothetical protein